MTIAEDRILSFVAVFSTGHGTKWIPGATFYYQPEVTWATLLRQRRRWINGTFATFLYYFFSKRADERINGGAFDSFTLGKNFRVLRGFWFLQLCQLLLAFYSPAIFGSAIYVGLTNAMDKTILFNWMKNYCPYILYLWTGSYLLIYSMWAIYSISVRNYYFYLFEDQTSQIIQQTGLKGLGVVPESLCQILAFLGFIYIFPVYYSIWTSIYTDGIGIVGGLVIASLVFPIGLGFLQSITSAIYYVIFIPWFLVFIVFYLVFITSYSFSRLWDTSWGNRETDNEGIDHTKTKIKNMNIIFVSWLILSNCFLTLGLISLYHYNYKYTIVIMFIAFSPMIGQLVFALLFIIIGLFYRNCFRTFDSANEAYHYDKLLFNNFDMANEISNNSNSNDNKNVYSNDKLFSTL